MSLQHLINGKPSNLTPPAIADTEKPTGLSFLFRLANIRCSYRADWLAVRRSCKNPRSHPISRHASPSPVHRLSDGLCSSHHRALQISLF